MKKLFLGMGVFIVVIVLAMLLAKAIAAPQASKTPNMAKKPQKIKVWQVPQVYYENLQNLIDTFDRDWRDKVDEYRIELRTQFKEFRDLPDDAVIRIEQDSRGNKYAIFIRASDLAALQQQVRLQQQQAIIEAQEKALEEEKKKKGDKNGEKEK